MIQVTDQGACPEFFGEPERIWTVKNELAHNPVAISADLVVPPPIVDVPATRQDLNGLVLAKVGHERQSQSVGGLGNNRKPL